MYLYYILWSQGIDILEICLKSLCGKGEHEIAVKFDLLSSIFCYIYIWINKFAHSVVKHVIFNKYNSISILIFQMFLFFKIKEWSWICIFLFL